MISQEEFFKAVQAVHQNEDCTLLKKAYAYGQNAHRGQQRKSGLPFFIHPVEVGTILNEMRLDIPSIIAGLLHDTVEDTHTSLEEIKKEFTEEIAFLVDGVTKLDKIVFTSREDKQAENFRKMLVAMSQDIRVLLIKLADRLNNMRTIRHLSPYKQLQIAQETLDIYAPLANRLGISWLKMELQDLAIRTLKPDIGGEIERKLKTLDKQKQHYIHKVEQVLRKKLDPYLPKYELSHRFKHLYSIYHKMETQNLAFEQIHDLIGFRVLVETLEQCYETLGLIHALWKPVPGRVKDYIAMPKANRYRSLHTTVFCEDGYRVEFQIRSFEMHDIAERGIASHWHYKEGGGIKSKDTEKFHWLRQLLNWKNELADSDEFLDTIKLDLFVNEVYVFTPKGDVKELPYGSTPIDLAYSVHSAIGDKCVGVKVNDRIVPLSYVLKSGDVAEILTDVNSKPNKDWLRYAKTSRARAQIRRVIREEQRGRSIQIGKELLEKECKKFDIAFGKFTHSKEFLNTLSNYPFSDVDSLFAALGYGKVSAMQVLSRVFPKEKLQIVKPEEPHKEGIIQQIFRRVAARSRNLVKVDGLDNVLITFGKCCHPLPGDSIVGYVTRGRGVTVHTRDCAKILGTDYERRIEVEWDESRTLYDMRSVKVKILSEDRPGLLSQITKSISDQGVNITGAQIRTVRDAKAIIFIEINVANLAQLQSTVHALQKIDGIISVERVRV